MSMVKEAALSRADVERLAAAEPEWLRTRRLTAWDLYESTPLPGPKDEAWRRTDLKSLDLDSVKLPRSHGGVKDPATLPEFLRRVVSAGKAPGSVLLQWDGSTIYSRLAPALAARGVIFTDIQTAAREHGDLLQKYLLTDCVKPGESKFTALHAAVLSGGVFLYVPRGVTITEPLEFALWAEQPGTGVFNHTLVVAEEGASITLVERWGSANPNGEPPLHSGIVEVFAGPGAQVRFGGVQNWAGNLNSFTVRRALVERDARVDWTLGEFGGALTRAEVTSQVTGQGADSNVFLVFFGSGEQHLDVQTGMVHKSGAGHSTSDIQARGVLTDNARAVYRGLGEIQPGAKACKTFQREQTLVLSENARADAIPSLIIDEFDVEQAGHAATTGQVDREQLFYLMSRGIPRKEALKLIVTGFFAPLIDRLPVESLKADLQELIERRMEA